MKKLLSTLLFIVLSIPLYSRASFHHSVNPVSEYVTSVTFPANYVIGDYIEFLRVAPYSAGASGYYEISITYVRGNVAAAATHIASVTHANSALWRQTGRVNNNGYVDQGQNFTVDCNSEYGNARFRVRAINTLGVSTPLVVDIKVTSINLNANFTALNATGNDLTVNKYMPMTAEWDLFVGNAYSTNGASIAIKALENGNVGIGTATPNEKLAVNGKIRAKEVKVEVANWPDYVFEEGYHILSLSDLEKYIKVNGHLPDMPRAKDVENDGIALGEMNKLLLKKIEELTLILIEKDKEKLKDREKLNVLEEKLDRLILQLKKQY